MLFSENVKLKNFNKCNNYISTKTNITFLCPRNFYFVYIVPKTMDTSGL